LQKPISGVVAWLIIVTRRPFYIGDRIIIAGKKGDISNITLTYFLLDEIGEQY
jgi:small-conductance mechanosensitive channel